MKKNSEDRGKYCELGLARKYQTSSMQILNSRVIPKGLPAGLCGIDPIQVRKNRQDLKLFGIDENLRLKHSKLIVASKTVLLGKGVS